MGKKNKGISSGIGSTGFVDGLSFFDAKSIRKDDDKPEKKKPKKGEYVGVFSVEDMQRDADNFEGYYRIIKDFAILQQVPPERYKKAMKTIKKMIKLLREGRGDEVYDKERYLEYKEAQMQRKLRYDD